MCLLIGKEMRELRVRLTFFRVLRDYFQEGKVGVSFLNQIIDFKDLVNRFVVLMRNVNKYIFK